MLTERIAEWWAERWVKKNLSNLNPKGITDVDLSRLEDAKNGVISVRDDGFAVQAPAYSEMAGFLKLRREAKRRLPRLSESFARWLLGSPAFDTTVVCIWERPRA